MSSVISDTQLKLRDAGIQMKLALANARDEDVFRACVNAYVAAARSVTMVMERESAHIVPLLSWYKEQTAVLGKQPLFRFFNQQRTLTIHRGIVRPQPTSFPIDIEWTQQHDPIRGLVTSGHFTAHSEQQPAHVGDVLITCPGYAINWSLPEAAAFLPEHSTNLFRLCEDYFVQLKNLVHEWIRKREEFSPGSAG
jgi:hypothetical protein